MQLWQQLKVKSVDEIIGQQEALATLRAVTSGFVLIHGAIGCGKTSLALAYARERFGIELRELQTLYHPGKYFIQHCHASDFDLEDAYGVKLFFGTRTPTLLIVDEAQELTLKRQQTRLKTIPTREELTIVLVTQDANALEQSIRDRCAKVRLGALTARELPAFVQRACEVRGVAYDAEIVKALNRSECLRPRAIANAIDDLAAGKSIAQAVAGQR